MNDKDSLLESITTRIAQVIALAGLLGLLILAALTVLAVLLRWLANYPLLGVGDVSSLIIGVALACCMPLVFAERGNISVKILGNILGQRWKHLLGSFGSLVSLIIYILMIWQLWLLTNKVALSGETTWVVSWTIAPWYRFTTILLALCIPIQVLTTLSQFRLFLNPSAGSSTPGGLPDISQGSK